MERIQEDVYNSEPVKQSSLIKRVSFVFIDSLVKLLGYAATFFVGIIIGMLLYAFLNG